MNGKPILPTGKESIKQVNGAKDPIKEAFSPAIKALKGSFKTSRDFGHDYKKILEKEIIKKHG